MKITKIEKKLYYNKYKLEEKLKDLSKIIDYIDKFIMYKVNLENHSNLHIESISQKFNEYEINDIEQKIRRIGENHFDDSEETNAFIDAKRTTRFSIKN